MEALFNAFSKQHGGDMRDSPKTVESLMMVTPGGDMRDSPKMAESLMMVTPGGRALSMDDVSAAWARVKTAMLG